MTRLHVWAMTPRLCFAVAILSTLPCAGQTADTAAASQQQVLRRRVEHLASSLQSAQAQVDALRIEVEALRRDVAEAKAAGEPKVVADADPPPGQAEVELARVQEDHDVLAAEVKQHEQTKVESESRFPVRVTGLVLFNTFVNQGVVDQIDLPTSALLRLPGVSHGSVGGSMRQTWLGLEGRGPLLGNLQTSARVSLDFFGGTTSNLSSSPAGIVRLRTAAVRAETASDIFEARFDVPLISPRSPASFANVAQPALAWAGNLWTWAPELRWQHSLGAGQRRTLDLEAGLRDPYLVGAQPYPETQIGSPSELSRRPGYEGRVSWGSAADPGYRGDSYVAMSKAAWRVGGGGYYAKQNYGNSVKINTWALTADWLLPLTRWLRVSGEAYQGTGLGGLGGGAYRDVVQGTDRVSGAIRTIGLDAAGGWVQLQADVTPRLQWNAAFGQDAGSGSELRLLVLPVPTTPLALYARNRAITGNVIYRPWNSVLISPEYRRIVSWPFSGPANVANVFTISAGYQF